MTVRLHRTMTSRPSRRADSTRNPKCSIQLWRAAGDVDDFDRRAMREQLDDSLGHPRIHLLGARRTRIDVAMMARLVAHLADIDLQRARRDARQRRETMTLQLGVKCAGTCYFRSAAISSSSSRKSRQVARALLLARQTSGFLPCIISIMPVNSIREGVTSRGRNQATDARRARIAPIRSQRPSLPRRAFSPPASSMKRAVPVTVR